MIEENNVVNNSEKGLKIKYFTIDPSNIYGPHPERTLCEIQDWCEKHIVKDIQFIKNFKDRSTYAVVMYIK